MCCHLIESVDGDADNAETELEPNLECEDLDNLG